MSRAQMVGVALATLQATTATFLAAAFLEDISPADWYWWQVIQPMVVVAALANVYAWARRIRGLAVPASLLTLLAPWGFIYYGPILAVGLAIGAVFLHQPSIGRDVAGASRS